MEFNKILLPVQTRLSYRIFQVEGVGLSDWPGHEAPVPVLDAVAGPWEVVGGWCHPAHLEPRGSLESGFPLLQPPTLCEMSQHGPGVKTFTYKCSSGIVLRLSEGTRSGPSMCVK